EKLPAVREVDIDLWKPPQISWVKLNFDAAYKAQSNKSYSGFIIRNEKGEVMGSGISLHSNVLDAGLAEALACYQGLIFAKEMGFTKLEVEGDARVVIEKINQEEIGRADLDSIIADIKALEREGYSRSENTFWMEDIPAVAKELVAAEETSNVL
ncbi:hypothetical protein Gotur_024923, partial [Gossypium turneri]